jgi:SAM-dependent methyltransferase
MSIDTPVTVLRLTHWDRPADEDDLAMLSRCVGPTLDVGCGPGRLTAALDQLGGVVLGIDVVDSAVDLTRRRGGTAVRNDVFDAVPGEGRWETALLADGNVGIGGDPVALLTRLREVLAPHGRVVAEVAEPGTPHTDDWATLECDDERQVIRWSVVGIDAIERLAGLAGLAVVELLRCGGRWCAVLQAPA